MAVKFAQNTKTYFVLPFLSFIVLLFTWSMKLPPLGMLAIGVLLAATVFTAVHHAEVIALKLGEPFGSLALAVSVTVIEVGMILVLFLDSPIANVNLARDTVFSAVMISINGIVGVALVIKALTQRIATFNEFGVGGALATLGALCGLTLVLPSVTTSTSGPTFNSTQLAFVAIVSLILYVTFVAVQTVRHRDYFLPPINSNAKISEEEHVEPPTWQETFFSLGGLLLSLVTVVGLAKVTSPVVQGVVSDNNLPQMVVAISIALIVLLPESISAFKAARNGRTQTSLNLAYGSALASIGLTIPTIAIISILFSYQVNLGLNAAEIVLITLSFFVSALTLVQGKATLLQGVVHLSIFGSFIFFAIAP